MEQQQVSRNSVQWLFTHGQLEVFGGFILVFIQSVAKIRFSTTGTSKDSGLEWNRCSQVWTKVFVRRIWQKVTQDSPVKFAIAAGKINFFHSQALQKSTIFLLKNSSFQFGYTQKSYQTYSLVSHVSSYFMSLVV